MHKKILKIILSLLIIGIILVAINYFLFFDEEKQTSGTINLSSFANLQVDVLSADVEIIEGEEFTLSYTLHGREKIRNAEVVGDTLFFTTGFDFKWKPTKGDWKVTITIPKDTILEKVDIKTVAGDIMMANRDCNSIYAKSIAGEIELNHINCNDMTLDTVAEDIEIKDCVVSELVRAKSIAGKIETRLSAESIYAESFGGIKYQGLKQGNRFELKGMFPGLELRSVSGKIVIDKIEE